MSNSYCTRNAKLISWKKNWRAALGSVSLLMVACDSSVNSVDTDSLSLATPERIRNAQAINPSALTARATVNGFEVVLSPSADGTFTGNLSVPANSVVPVSIQFSEQVNGQTLVLATQTQQVNTGTANNRVIIRRSAYDFDAHDADGDSVSNIIEREENTDPLDANDAPPMVNVSVIASQPADAGNGSSNFTVEASVGNSVQTLQRSGNQFRGAFYTVDRSPVTVSADIVESVTGQRLSVASQSYELSSIFDQQTITFSESGYQLTNRDNDAQSDLAEVVAGTSIFESGEDMAGGGNTDSDSTDSGNTGTGNGDTADGTPEIVTFVAQFDIPAVIQNAGSVYAEIRVDGQLTGLIRNANSYTANYSVAAGTIAMIDVILLDNFNGSVYLVAQAQKTFAITSNQQLVQFVESDFSLQLDTDNDGVLNYLERERGADPLTVERDQTDTEAPVNCTVSDVPAQVIAAGASATQSLNGFVDCAGASFALSASDYQFSWNSEDNSIQWVLPASALPGSQLSYTVDVRNPADANELYASFQVSTTVGIPDTSCIATTSVSEFAVSRDVHVQGTKVFNGVQLRIQEDNRVALLAFDVPAGAAVTGNATLAITMGNDEGDGTIDVAQLENFQWSEADSELQVPPTATALGSVTNTWLNGQQYQFSLSGITAQDTGELTLLLSQSDGNDVAFLARESGSSAVLAVELSHNDCNSQ